MYFLLDVCENPHVLRTIYFGIIIKDIIFTIIPIGIIVMTLIDFSKAVIASKEDEQQKAVKLIPKRIMYAIVVFAIPWIVTALMNTLSSLKLSVALDYTTCIENAKKAKGNFEHYDKLLEAEEKLLKERSSHEEQKDDSSSGSGSNVNSDVAIRYINYVKNQVNKKYSDFGFPAGQHWCAYFVSYTLQQTKFDNGTSIWDYLKSKGSVGSGSHASNMWPAFKAINGWYKSKAYGGNYTPKPGDLIWFLWDGNWDGITQYSNHIGVVEYVEGNKVHTIEGNINGGGPTTTVVARKTYSLDSNCIIVYGDWNK